MFKMPRTCLGSEWLNVLIYLVLLFCCCVTSLNSPLKPDTVSPHVSPENLGKVLDSSHRKDDSLELKERPRDHRTVVARKGATLEGTVDPSPESCDESAKSKFSPNCSTKSPVPKTDTVDKSSRNSSNIPSSNSRKVVTNGTVSTTAAPVMKPRFTIDNSSDPDYDESGSWYSSNANGFVTTFSLSVFIIVLLVVIIVLFLRLRYKFSVEQNYRRVDYLIDGMYID